MADEEFGKLMDHEYDGIREYDNPCPTWWHLTLWGTVVFSAAYFVYYHVGPMGWSVSKSYENAVAENLKLRFAEIGELQIDEPTLIEHMGLDDSLVIGSTVYQTHCKSCHGADGAGLVGPNLTDDNYKHIREIVDIADVVENGASAGAMPAWNSRLHQNEIVLVSAFVASLRGQSIQGPGDAVETRDGKYKPISPWPTLADTKAEDAEDEVSDTVPEDATELGGAT